MDTADPPPIFSLTSLFSLLAVASLLGAAYTLSARLLPSTSTTKVRFLFIWHLFDALVHFTLEGSYLYNCFYTYIQLPTKLPLPAGHEFPFTPHGVSFLGNAERLHGAFYGTSLTAKLWQEYAKADRRWGGADLTVISLELLTVFVMAPLAIYVCYLLKNQESAKAWFWMTVIATGELYGGFMTFAPEWLTNSPNLDTSNFMYLWVYLFFFNTLWVWIPLWILYEAYGFMGNAVTLTPASAARKTK